MAGKAAERGTERAAQKATPGEGKAQRNRELGDRRGQPAGAHMGGEWHRRLRGGRGPRRVGLGRGPQRPGGKGMQNWGRGQWGRGPGRREGGRREGEGKGEAEVARCAGALGGCPRERAGGGRGARRAAAAAAAANGQPRRRSGEGGGGGAEGRGWLDRSGLPLPEVGGALAAGKRGCSLCSLCSWISHSDRRHFTALRAPSSFLPPSSSPLTPLPVVTCIRFTGTKVPLPRSMGAGRGKRSVLPTGPQLRASAEGGSGAGPAWSAVGGAE